MDFKAGDVIDYWGPVGTRFSVGRPYMVEDVNPSAETIRLHGHGWWPAHDFKRPFAAPEGRKNDADKPDFSLIPPAALWEVAEVMTLGKEKYGKGNYLKLDRERVLAALYRHLTEYHMAMTDPEGYTPWDSESKCSHMAHVVANALMLMHMVEP